MGTKYTYSDGATYQSENTPITISRIPTGEYMINAVKGDFEGKIAFTASPGTQNVTITVSVPVYSIIYDKSLASDPTGCLTYAGQCEGFTPMVGGNGNADEGSWAEGNGTIFDEIKVGYRIDSSFNITSKSAVSGNTSYNCFTRIPKIYQRVTQLDSNRVQLDISLKPFPGGTLHPAFIMDGVELTYKYIGRYVGSYKSALKSTSGQTVKGDTTRAQFRTYAKANGSNYGLLSYYDWDLVNKLYLFAFKSFNSQYALGRGRVNTKSIGTTGLTDGKSWMYGSSSSTSEPMAFLGIENWWGGGRKIIDNYISDSSYIYASNSSSPSDSVSDMTVICAVPDYESTSGICPLVCGAGLNDFFIGKSGFGSYNSSGMCDKQYFSTGTSIAEVGGGWTDSSYAGAFCIIADFPIAGSGWAVYTRLVHWE